MNRLLAVGTFVMATAALAVSLTQGAKPAADLIVGTEETEAQTRHLRDLERRIELLESSNDALERRAFDSATPQVQLANSGTVAATGTGNAEAVVQEAAVTGNASPALIQAVRQAQQVLAAEQRQERATRFAQMQARAATQEIEKWKKFSLTANLNSAQEQALTARLESERQQRTALMNEVRAGTQEFRDVRQQTRQLRQETDQAMAKVLSADQLQQFTAMRQDDARDGRGRRSGNGEGNNNSNAR